MSHQKIIPVVALGVYRHVAETTVELFEGTPYTLAAILDLQGPKPAFHYTPHNLGVVLSALIPRPLVFVTGARISEEMTDESIAVWKEFVKDEVQVKEEETLVIDMCHDPPQDGDWKTHVLSRLDAKYGKR